MQFFLPSTRRTVRRSLCAAGLLLPLAGQAQTTIFTETFETSPGGFTVVNGATGNRWVVGTAAGNGPATAGSNAAYVSDGAAGNPYNYATNAASTVHLYRDVTFPAGQNSFLLSFDWKGQGEGASTTYDYLAVFMVPTSYTPTAGTLPSGAGVTALAALNLQAAYTRANIGLPNAAALAGTTQRLVFVWRNDSSLGNQPPAALDNVTLTGRTVTPLAAGTYTINGSQPTAGTNFQTFTEAITQLNTGVPAGAVTFDVAAGQTFAETPPALLSGGTAAGRVTFRKTGTGANPVLSVGAGGAGLDVVGADYLAFDGIDLTATGNGPTYGFRIRNASATDGCRNVVVRNAVITLNRVNTASAGVVQSTAAIYNGVTPTDTTGTNRNTRYENLTIRNSYHGLLVVGNSTFPERNTEVTNVTVGSGAAADIGGGNPTTYGLRLENIRGLRASGNRVQGLASGSGNVYGAYLYALAGDAAAPSSFFNNRIANLKFTDATSSSTLNAVYGVYVLMSASATAGASVVNVYNNEVRDLDHAFASAAPATASRLIRGLFVTGGGFSGSQLNLWHNSVLVNGSASPNLSSAAFEYGASSSADGALTLRNNVFVNTSAAQTGTAKHYAAYLAGTVYGGGTSSSNYNNLYVANAGGFVGRTSAGDHATLADLRASTMQEANSLSLDPQFGSTDLRPLNLALQDRGTPVAAVPRDIIGTLRSPTTPDMGAYEFRELSTRGGKQANLGLQAWPVPLGSVLRVSVPASLYGPAELSLLDALGRTVHAQAVALGTQPATLGGLDALPAGVYSLHLRLPDGRQQAVPVLK